MEKVKRKLGDARPNRREIFSVPNGLSFLRLCLHPKVECDLPGRLRISFSKYHLLPKEALPYLHSVSYTHLTLPTT
mgnify:CR=1 FL=1